MKIKFFILSVFTSLFILTGCENLLDENDTKSTVQLLEGVWECDDATITKSTMLKYQVYITPSTVDSTQIFMSNFHKLGNTVEALGTVSGNTITIPNQTLSGGYLVRGKGSISSNLKEISWTYYVDDGSGQEEEVNAVYSFLY
jgi:hypothetical protein